MNKLQQNNLLFFTFVGLVIGWMTTTGVKSQIVRLLDVFAYGPFLLYISMREKNLLFKIILILMGSTTISYNLKNFIMENKNNVTFKIC